MEFFLIDHFIMLTNFESQEFRHGIAGVTCLCSVMFGASAEKAHNVHRHIIQDSS